ncbi:MAG: type II toxin-antitoxin system VapB family antitoxin [Pseudomonadota bacterium]
METLVTINDKLMNDALRLSGLTNDNEVIEMSLKLMIKLRLKKQEVIKKYRGELKWDGGAWERNRDDIRVVQ